MAFGLLKSSVPSFITGKLEGSLHCGPSLAHCDNFTELPSLTMYQEDVTPSLPKKKDNDNNNNNNNNNNNDNNNNNNNRQKNLAAQLIQRV